jgi:hypothetical protein
MELTQTFELKNPETTCDPKTYPNYQKESDIEQQPSKIVNEPTEVTDYVKSMDSEAIKSSTRLAIGFCVAFLIVAITFVLFSLCESVRIFLRVISRPRKLSHQNIVFDILSWMGVYGVC